MEQAPLELGTRAKHLLLSLLNEKGPVVIANLARQFGVSPRSIRYDLDEIEAWLEPTSIKLRRRPRVGIWIEGEDEGVSRTKQSMGLVEEYRPVLSPEQRRNIIVARLLQCDEPVTSHALADELHVSRTTVFADLDNVEGWLERRGLSLVRRSNYGLRIVGEESAWRQAVSDLLNEFAESGELGRLIMEVGRDAEPEDSAPLGGAPHLMALLGGVDLKAVEKMVRLAESSAGVEFTTGSYASLVFHVAIAVQRLSQARQVDVPRERLASLRSQGEYTIAGLLAMGISEEFGVEVPKEEVGNLALHLIGAKVRGPARTVSENAAALQPGLDVEASAAARAFIRAAERELKVPLIGDETLLSGLTLHLRPALGRLRYGLPVTNPLHDETLARYPRTFAAAGAAAAEIELITGLIVPPEEVGYLTLHLVAAVLRHWQKSAGRRKVIIASTAGVGVSDILAARLAAEFSELEVVANSSAHGLGEILRTVEPDFVIGTTPIPGVGVDVVVVNPLLPEDDVARIRVFMDRRYRPDEDRLLAESVPADT